MSQSPIPILAIGPDCHRLLECASVLASRRIIFTSSSLALPIGGFEGHTWIDAGALLLAKGGVCYLGDWCKFGTGKNSVASQIISGYFKSILILRDFSGF